MGEKGAGAFAFQPRELDTDFGLFQFHTRLLGRGALLPGKGPEVLMHHRQVVLLVCAGWQTRMLNSRSSSYDWVGLGVYGGVVFVYCFPASEKTAIYCRAC